MPPRAALALLAAAVPRRWAAGCLFLLAAAGASGAESDGQALEVQIKAAYLYKFTGHVEWPPEAFADTAAPFVIGVVGAGDMAEELSRIKPGRAVNERPVEVRVLRPGDAARGVQLIFVGGRDGTQLKRAMEQYKALPALLISDSPGAMDAGCVINFVLVDNRVRFEISVGNAERHGLKVSSRLLAVAQRVDTGRP